MTTDQASTTSNRTVYTGRTTAWPIVVGTSLAAVLLVVGAVTGDSSDPVAFTIVLGLVAAGVLANVLTASSVRASAGPKGFDIRWGTVGWPRCSYALGEIERADVADVPWWRVTYSLWWTPKRTSCTIRSGPAVRLVLRNGRIVTVTVPDPALAVRAIEDAHAR